MHACMHACMYVCMYYLPMYVCVCIFYIEREGECVYLPLLLVISFVLLLHESNPARGAYMRESSTSSGQRERISSSGRCRSSAALEEPLSQTFRSRLFWAEGFGPDRIRN